MVFKIEKLKKKVDKIINSQNLGAELIMEVYSITTDRYGKNTKVLEVSVISFGAKISGSGRNKTQEGFNQETLDLILPYDLDIYPVVGKEKVFTFMSRKYTITDIRPIDGIQDSGAGTEVTMKLYEE